MAIYQTIKDKLLSLVRPKKAMTFSVGEGLTPTQKTIAEQAVRKPADIVSKQFEPEMTASQAVSILGRKVSGEAIPEDLLSEARTAAIKGTSELVMGFTGPSGQIKKTAAPVVEDIASVIKKEGDDAISKLIGAVKKAGPVRQELETKYTEARAQRAGQVAQTFEKERGQKGYFEALGKLKGELTTPPKFEPLQGADKITEREINTLFNKIQSNADLDIFDKVSASNGLQNLLEGRVPPKSQLSLMEDIFGKDLINAVAEKRPFITKLGDIATEILNVPRSLITSFDMSAVLRQGIVLTTTEPKIASKAVVEMFRQTLSPARFDEWLLNIPKNPKYRLIKDSGLYISNPNKIAGGLSEKEEAFMTNLAQKIPIIGRVIKASERAYVSYLNKLRVDTFTKMSDILKAEGVADSVNLKSLATFINNATGRGDLRAFSRSAQLLNNFFFSPRLIASRFNLLDPTWYARQTPAVRKIAIKKMMEFVGVGFSVLGLAKANGANVEIDPRSTDFAKIRIGNVRWDIWGGFQPWIRVISQLVSGQKKLSEKKEIYELSGKKYPYTTRLDVVSSFLRGKLAPIPGLALELLEGQKLFGGKITLPKEVAENVIPLYLQDMDEVIREIGPEAIFTAGVPAFFGTGLQVYKEKKKNRF